MVNARARTVGLLAVCSIALALVFGDELSQLAMALDATARSAVAAKIPDSDVSVEIQDLSLDSLQDPLSKHAEELAQESSTGRGDADEDDEAERSADEEAELSADEDGEDGEDGEARPTTAAAVAAANATCAVTSEHVRYTLDRIRSAEVALEPYPHYFVENVFSPDLYACIRAKLPRDAAYKRLRSKQERFYAPIKAKYGSEKFRQGLISRGFDAEFWQGFAEAFEHADLRDLWVEKFERVLSQRVTDWREYMAKSLFLRMELNRDREGYVIPPHTDRGTKWVTMLYYLAPDDSHKEAGTCVIRSKSGREQTSSDWESWDDDDFEIARQAPFLPNSVFAFAPCYKSWHAVPKMNTKFTRDTIQSFVMAKNKLYKKGRC